MQKVFDTTHAKSRTVSPSKMTCQRLGYVPILDTQVLNFFLFPLSSFPSPKVFTILGELAAANASAALPSYQQAPLPPFYLVFVFPLFRCF